MENVTRSHLRICNEPSIVKVVVDYDFLPNSRMKTFNGPQKDIRYIQWPNVTLYLSFR